MGAMMIGVIISAVLHGVCLVQAFFYFTSECRLRLDISESWMSFSPLRVQEGHLVYQSPCEPIIQHVPPNLRSGSNVA